jgi:chorismate--pyruvate lyase
MRSTHWRAHHRLRHSDIPSSLWDWLLDPTSLTRRLQQLCGEFRVRLLEQSWSRPLHDEARALGMRGNGSAFIREVQLFCDGTPWVFARTVIPRRTLCGKYRRLTRLGNRSLGAVLFADPSMRRETAELAALSAAHPLFERATRPLLKKPRVIWGRRSRVYLQHKPLLLSEVFLHDMRNHRR